jgi:hypothetical protein
VIGMLFCKAPISPFILPFGVACGNYKNCPAL